jgi:hypothetical protein
VVDSRLVCATRSDGIACFVNIQLVGHRRIGLAARALQNDPRALGQRLLSTRDADAAWTFMQDLAGRLKNRVQLTTDGHKAYLDA